MYACVFRRGIDIADIAGPSTLSANELRFRSIENNIRGIFGLLVIFFFVGQNDKNNMMRSLKRVEAKVDAAEAKAEKLRLEAEEKAVQMFTVTTLVAAAAVIVPLFMNK